MELTAKQTEFLKRLLEFQHKHGEESYLLIPTQQDYAELAGSTSRSRLRHVPDTDSFYEALGAAGYLFVTRNRLGGLEIALTAQGQKASSDSPRWLNGS